MLREFAISLVRHLSQFSPARRDETTSLKLVPSPGRRGLGRGVCWILLSIILFFPVSALLWEDLGLDLYKQIDGGFATLERKQYEYELTWQWETSIDEVIAPILNSRWLDCDFTGSKNIESALWNTDDNQVAFILQRCWYEDWNAPIRVVEEVNSALIYIKNTFRERSEEKSRATYEIAKIWLYSDGNLENSPFDLIDDLREIDRVIFTQELEYNWEAFSNSNNDENLDAFLEEDKAYLYDEQEDISDEEEIEDGETDLSVEEVDWLEEELEDFFTHSYVCLPWDNTSWLDESNLDDILESIEWWGSSLWGTYNTVTDEWGCNPTSFFCIVIEIESSDYGLKWWETMTIEKVLATAAGHLEKPANASLTQKKMTTNNFEISSMIQNLPDMLRGFWIQVSTKPVPILEFENESQDVVDGPQSNAEKKLVSYYKNLSLDFERRNDLMIFRKISGGRSEEVQKVLQTSAGMPAPYVEDRVNELKKFQRALAENNRLLSRATDSSISYDDMEKFADQFAELERFTAAIEDFVESFTWHVTRLRDIPTWWN